MNVKLILYVLCAIALTILSFQLTCNKNTKLLKQIENNSIFNSWLLLESKFYPEMQKEKSIFLFENIITHLSKKIDEEHDLVDKTRLMLKCMSEDFKFISVDNAYDSTLILSESVLKNRKGHCVSFSVLLLSIAERFELPLYAKAVPGHIYLFYDDDVTCFNIETTANNKSMPDTFYKSFLNEKNNLSGNYMKKMSNNQVLGEFSLTLGEVFNRAGDCEKALDAYTIGIELSPNSAQLHNNIDQMYIDLNRIKDAKKNLVKALDIDSGLWQIYSNLAFVSLELGDYVGAINYSREAIDLISDQIVIRSYTGKFYMEENIEEISEKLLRENGLNVELLVILGIECANQKKHVLAKKLFCKAIESNENCQIFSFLANVSFHLGNYSDAINYAIKEREGLGYNPTRNILYYMKELSNLYVMLAIAYEKKYKYQQSMDALENALKIYPDNLLARKQKARMCE